MSAPNDLSELAQALVTVALQPRDHQLALRALLSAFIALAEDHACCTVGAAGAAQRAADRLLAVDAARTAPTSIRVH